LAGGGITEADIKEIAKQLGADYKKPEDRKRVLEAIRLAQKVKVEEKKDEIADFLRTVDNEIGLKPLKKAQSSGKSDVILERLKKAVGKSAAPAKSTSNAVPPKIERRGRPRKNANVSKDSDSDEDDWNALLVSQSDEETDYD